MSFTIMPAWNFDKSIRKLKYNFQQVAEPKNMETIIKKNFTRKWISPVTSLVYGKIKVAKHDNSKTAAEKSVWFFVRWASYRLSSSSSSHWYLYQKLNYPLLCYKYVMF